MQLLGNWNLRTDYFQDLCYNLNIERDLSADENQACFFLWKYKPSQLHFSFILLSLGRGQKEKGRKILCIKLHTLNCMHESLLSRSPQSHISSPEGTSGAGSTPCPAGRHKGLQAARKPQAGSPCPPFLIFPEVRIGLHSQMGFLSFPFSALSLWEHLGVLHPSVWCRRDLPPGASPVLHHQPACCKEPALLHQHTQQSRQLPSAVIGPHLTLPHAASCRHN